MSTSSILRPAVQLLARLLDAIAIARPFRTEIIIGAGIDDLFLKLPTRLGLCW
jgi:hypothetical protein